MTEKPIRSGRAAQRALAYTLTRDKHTCWICGQPGADTRDHIIPVETDPTRANDPTNWAAAHGAARPEYNCPGQYARRDYAGPRRPEKTSNIAIVIGPPASGKTTYVASHRKPTDIVVDHDALAQALGSHTKHTTAGPHASIAKTARQAVIDTIISKKLNAWIIQTAPTPQQITTYTRAKATPTLIDPGRSACIHRARTQRQSWTIPAINDWYENHAERLQEWAATTPTTPTTGTDRQW